MSYVFAKAAGPLLEMLRENSSNISVRRYIISIYLMRITHIFTSVINILDSTRLIYCDGSSARFISEIMTTS